MSHFLDSSDSKACLAWDMVERLVLHQVVNEWAREGTYDVETGLENILGDPEVLGDPWEASHL